MDGRSDADDVAGADSRSQGRAQRLKAVDIAFALILCRKDQLQRMRKAENLQQAQADRQHDARADQQHQ